MNREKISSGLLDPRSKLAGIYCRLPFRLSRAEHSSRICPSCPVCGDNASVPEMEEGFLYRSYLCSYVFLRSVSSTAIVRDTAEYHHAGMSFLPVYFTDVCSLLYCDTDFQDWGIYQCIYSDGICQTRSSFLWR